MGEQRVQIENTFGRIAIAHGMATAAQVEDALRALKKLAELGMRERLGAIMVKKGYITPENVTRILEIQGKRAQSRIEGYEMISKLGQGAMGAVFKAKQVSLDRIVALKILSPSLAKDKSFVKRFLTEARSVAKLNHRNIIQGIDVGESRGHYYFAMEFVDGVTLSDILRDEGPMEEARALRIVEEITQALDHAHRNGLVHRDVKPDNVMVTEEGDAKLCDLGLAKSAAADASGQSDAGSTSVGRVVGTPHYIAPEQARGEKQIDIRADIYSLGATLFHVLTGRTPYSGENPQIVMTKHLTEPVDDPRDVRDGISEGAALLVLKMMAKNAEDRYQTPEELFKDIRTVGRGKVPAHLIGAFAGRRAGLRRAGAATAAQAGRAAVEVRRPRVRVISKRRRRSGVTGLMFALGVVVLVGFLAVKLLPSIHRPKPGGPSETPPAVAAKPRPSVDPAEVSPDPSDVSEADRAAKALYERAMRFTADERNAQNYPAIFRRLREVITSSSGARAHYADKARTALAGYRQRQGDDRNRRILELRAEARKLVEKGRFREAYALWDRFPKNLLPESREKAEEILDSQRKLVLQAARRRFDELAKGAREKAAAGEFDEAVRLLEEAERIGLRRIVSRLPAERRRLEAASARRRAETERRASESWETTWEDILGLAASGDYEGARVMAQEATKRREFKAHIDDLVAVEFDMRRLALRQEFAVDGLEAKIGKGRVVVHRDGRGYTGTVTEVLDGRITIAPATGGTGPVVILEQDLTPEDIKRYAPIVFTDVEGRYDYAILLIYSGQPKNARPLLQRCLSSRQFAEKARRHLKRIGE